MNLPTITLAEVIELGLSNFMYNKLKKSVPTADIHLTPLTMLEVVRALPVSSALWIFRQHDCEVLKPFLLELSRHCQGIYAQRFSSPHNKITAGIEMMDMGAISELNSWQKRQDLDRPLPQTAAPFIAEAARVVILTARFYCGYTQQCSPMEIYIHFENAVCDNTEVVAQMKGFLIALLERESNYHA